SYLVFLVAFVYLLVYNKSTLNVWRCRQVIIGYCRVSTKDQDTQLQEAAIKEYAQERELPYELYIEKVSGTKTNRTELQNALKAAQKGNIFVVYKLDRLARSTKQLIDITTELEEQGIEFVSLSDNIDTSTSAGKAMFGMLAVFAEFERNIIAERTRSGLEAARKKGKKGGRTKLNDKIKRQVKTLYENGESASDIAKEYGIGRSTVYKIINDNK